MTENSRDNYELVVGDVRNTLNSYSGRFRLIIADPPFGIDFNKSSHEYGTAGARLYPDSFGDGEYLDFTREWLKACHDALTPDGSLYAISGWNNLPDLLQAVKEGEFNVLNHCIWHYSWGVYTKKRFVTSHYHVLTLVRDIDNYVFNKQSKYEEDVWFFPGYNRGNDPDRIKGHPCQLPLVLLEKIIKTSSEEGDWIGDVFSGSGGTSLAARRLGRNVVAFELREEYAPVIKNKARFGKKVKTQE